ncbi:MAG: DUF3574 domain-containing protein [Tolypothrix carrinoi HA7290-LM1]|jgi:hypothetical protein|nr:DUF3574 domain-containing protein [Tolypothrix carrinoi HA7290-LM1]
MQKSVNSLILTSLLFLAPIHINTFVRAQSPQTSTQNSSEKIFTKDELYFGLSKLGGDTISELEWQLFLNRVVTPRFREGLTVIDAYGQYLNSYGMTREKTKIVILIYENSRTKNQMIEEVIASYKRKFQQESVLRVTSTVKVSF